MPRPIYQKNPEEKNTHLKMLCDTLPNVKDSLKTVCIVGIMRYSCLSRHPNDALTKLSIVFHKYWPRILTVCAYFVLHQSRHSVSSNASQIPIKKDIANYAWSILFKVWKRVMQKTCHHFGALCLSWNHKYPLSVVLSKVVGSIKWALTFPLWVLSVQNTVSCYERWRVS